MRNKILFIESYDKCRELGLLSLLSKFDCEFDGRRFYNRNEDFFRVFDLVIFTNYASSLSNYICCKCRDYGVKTLFFSDGVFDLANSIRNPQLKGAQRVLYGFLPFDFFAKVTDVFLYGGAPEFMSYVPERIISYSEKSESNCCSKPLVLITTANTAYFNDCERSRLVRLVIDVTSYLNEREISYSYRVFDEELLRAIPDAGLKLNDIEESFEDTLSRYSHVIATPSSVVVTSMFHNKATAQLIYRSEPTSVMTAWNIPSVEVFKESFDSYIGSDDALMDVQRKIASRFVNAASPCSVVERALECDVASFSSDLVRFRQSEAERILNSSFNFNIEYFARRIYENNRSSRFFKFIKRLLKQ